TELTRAERAGEVASLVDHWLLFDHISAGESRGQESHLAAPAALLPLCVGHVALQVGLGCDLAAVVVLLIPLCCTIDGFGPVPYRLPVETPACLGRVELQRVRFAWSARIGCHFIANRGPGALEPADHIFDSYVALFRGAEVPGFRGVLPTLPQALRQKQ